MSLKEILQKKSPYCFEVPSSYRSDMRVPARVYTFENTLDDVLKDRSLNQLINVATLPGIVGAALAMPDVHEGYGFPIGGVAATEYPHGVISPGGIGYDINCGVRLLRSSVTHSVMKDHLEPFARTLYSWVPSGVGTGGRLKLSLQELDEVLNKGVEWMLERNYATLDDIRHIESQGRLPEADASCVLQNAKSRGRDQLGTLGSGNHFVEVDVVDSIFDEKAAQAFGLFKGQLVVLIHTGSRGLGHQVATDYIREMMKLMPKYNIQLPDRELACVPFSEPAGKRYFAAMSAAANFAWCNRQLITWEVRKAWREEFGTAGGELELVYDVAHNIAKIEEHVVNGERKKLIVHRKGATRAFSKGNPELAQEYRHIGQPVLIPGSMGTASYVLVGAEGAERETFASCCHGAGRRLSRFAAKQQVVGKQLQQELHDQGIFIQAGSVSGLAEEAPLAYKDIDDVVSVVDMAGIAKKVARLRPCVVVKG